MPFKDNNDSCNDGQAIDVWHSRPLSLHCWSKNVRFNDFIESVWHTFSDEQRARTQSQSNNKGTPVHVLLKVLIANLYHSWLQDPTMCIGIPMGTGDYRPNSRYNYKRISNRIRDVVQVLEERNLIQLSKGSNNRTTSGQNRTTRIWATKTLIEQFLRLDITEFDIDLHSGAETVILRRKFIEDEFGIERDENWKPIKAKGLNALVEYQETDETLRMRALLQEYNDLLKRTHVDVANLHEPIISREVDGTVQKIAIGQEKKFVRRIFSRCDWSSNGRFYGGFWQQIGSEHRKHIRLNNQITVEHDYSGLHVNLLYIEKGEYGPDEPYFHEELLLPPPFDLAWQRKIIKRLALMGINAKSEADIYSAFRNSFDPHKSPDEVRLKDVQLRPLLGAFLKKNPLLEADIATDKGIKLMYLDSQITEEIIKVFLERSLPILSVHDSYIASFRQSDLLHEAMKTASNKVVGTSLALKQNMMGFGEIQMYRQHDSDVYFNFIQALPNERPATMEHNVRWERFRLHNGL